MVENKLAANDLIQKFYKQSNNRSKIEVDNSNVKYPIGSNLQQTLDILRKEGLQERARFYEKEGGWSGDLYHINKRLFRLQNEISAFPGNSGRGGNLIANVYEFIMDSCAGKSQYLSIILSGKFNKSITNKFSEADFAPKHNYLAKNDPCIQGWDKDNKLWLDELIKFDSPINKIMEEGEITDDDDVKLDKTIHVEFPK